jgi:hypothetical protein
LTATNGKRAALNTLPREIKTQLGRRAAEAVALTAALDTNLS